MKAAIFAVFLAVTAGAGFATWFGFGGQDSEVQRSMRAGSAGNLAFARVK